MLFVSGILRLNIHHVMNLFFKNAIFILSTTVVQSNASSKVEDVLDVRQDICAQAISAED